MSSSIKKQVEEINKLIFHGKFKKALTTIEKNLKANSLKKGDELNLLNLKCEVLYYTGKADKLSKLTERIVEESKKVEDIRIQVNAFIASSNSLFFKGDWNGMISICDKGLKILQKHEKQSKLDFTTEKFWLYMNKAMGLWQQGRIEAKELFFESINFGKKSSLPLIQLRSKYWEPYLGIFYREFDSGEDCFEEFIIKFTKIGNKFDLGVIHILKATISSMKRDYLLAIESYKKASDYFGETNNTFWQLGAYHDMGINYRIIMKLDEAIDCFTKFLELDRYHYIVYANLGLCYFWKYDLEKAEETYLKALDSSKKTNEKRIRTYILSNLVELYVEMNKLDEAKKYLGELEKHKKENVRKGNESIYLVSSARLLQASPNMSDWIKAVEIYEEIIKDEEIWDYYREISQFQILTIRLRELQVTTNTKVLDEVNKQIDNLQIVAESKKYYRLQIEIYRLKSQIALLELDVEKASNLLITAHTLAEEKGLALIAQRIVNDQEKLKQQTNMWVQFKEKKAPLSETLKHVPIVDSTKEIAKDTLIEVRDEESGKIIEYRKLFALKI